MLPWHRFLYDTVSCMHPTHIYAWHDSLPWHAIFTRSVCAQHIFMLPASSMHRHNCCVCIVNCYWYCKEGRQMHRNKLTCLHRGKARKKPPQPAHMPPQEQRPSAHYHQCAFLLSSSAIRLNERTRCKYLGRARKPHREHVELRAREGEGLCVRPH